jgi:hypothetical protein
MKKTVIALLIITGLFSCKDKNIPDVSGISVPLQTQRFEQDFFAIDTNDIPTSFDNLQKNYPNFLTDYLINILELPSDESDSGKPAMALVKRFIADYKAVKDSADKVFSNFNQIERDVKTGLQYVKHYFPAYKAPAKLITFIGPMEGYSDVITTDALAVGLQLHMGSGFSFYTSNIGQSVYPAYVSRRFTPNTIAVNCMKNIINDIVPENAGGRPLIEQMIEKGKRLYVLDKIMPTTPDTLKTGYTARQLKGCYENEGKIWNYFLVNSLLFTTEPALLKGYIEDAPNTPEFGSDSPGSIGVFAGWQIVKKYMEKHADLSLFELLKTDSKKIYEESKYKPQ